MTLLAADDRAYLSTGRAGRYALAGLVLNAADAQGCMWLAEVEGWDAPEVETPLDRRPSGHGGYAGEPTYNPRVLAIEGTVAAPTPEDLDAAKERWTAAVYGELPTMSRYEHLDEAPARGLWVYPTGKPRWRYLDDRLAEFAVTLLAEDPVKTGTPFTVGPVRLASLGGEGGYALAGVSPLTAYSSASATETRRNRVPNPRAASATSWTINAGTGGTAALSAQSSGGPSGESFARATYSVANTTAAGTSPSASVRADGRAAQPLPIPVTPGEVLSGAVEARTSVAQRVSAAVWFFDAAGATTGIAPSFVAGPAAVLTANTWTRLLVEGVTVPAGSAYAMVGASTASGTGAVPFPVGATFDATRGQLEATPTAAAYFDGATADAPPLEYAWSGAANASPSTQQTAAYSTAAAAGGSYVGLVPNDGDEPAMPVYRISGPLPDPVVQVSTGEYAHLDLTLTADDTAVIDTASGTVQVNGVSRYDAWGPGSTFPLIPPGGAEVRLRSLTGGADPAAQLLVDSVSAWR